MVDIAVVSVISSAAVAVVTIGANFIAGERQRKHEADLDFEKRVWERKSEALFKVIDECRGLIDSIDDAGVNNANKTRWALYLSKRRDALSDLRSTVEALASAECRSALSSIIEAMNEQGVKEFLGRRVDRYENEMYDDDTDDPSASTPGAALLAQMNPMTQTIQRRNRYRGWIKDAEEQAVADFEPNLPELRERAQKLIDAARESVRRPKD